MLQNQIYKVRDTGRLVTPISPVLISESGRVKWRMQVVNGEFSGCHLDVALNELEQVEAIPLLN